MLVTLPRRLLRSADRPGGSITASGNILRGLRFLLPGSVVILLAVSSARGGDEYTFTPPTLVNDEGMAGILSSTESSGRRTIAAYGGDVYVVWADERAAPARVYFAKSEDLGVTWGPDLVVTDSAAAGAFPALAVAPDGVIHVAWQDFRPSPRAKIHAARSLDGGDSFTPAVWVSESLGVDGWDGHPAIACAGPDTVYAAWLYHVDFTRMIYAARSVDGGLSFGNAVPVEYRCRAKGDPVVAAVGGRVCVAWEDRCDYYVPCGFDDSFCGKRIYLAMSLDAGESFAPPRAATPMYGPAADPALAMGDGGSLYLVWSGVAAREELPDIYFALNPAGGYDYPSSDLVQVDGDVPGVNEQDEPSLGVDSQGSPFVTWRDNRHGGSDVYFAAGMDTGETFGPAVRLTVPGMSGCFPSVAVTTDALAQVAWTQDDLDGGCDTYASRGGPAELASVEAPAGGSAAAPGRSLIAKITIAPNPAGPGAVMSWPASGAAGSVVIYDVAGRLVLSLPGSGPTGGLVSAAWDGRDAGGRDVPPGVYFVETRGGGKPMRARLVLVR